jgi:peptidoglycan/LPS O-acetylase OafA/YrhL
VGYAPAMAAAFALLLASMVLPESSALDRMFTTRPLIALGVISYGVFLWHAVVIETLQRTPLWTYELPNTLLTLGLTLVVATASWILIERRFLARKDRPLWTRQGGVTSFSFGRVSPRPAVRFAHAKVSGGFRRARMVLLRGAESAD